MDLVGVELGAVTSSRNDRTIDCSVHILHLAQDLVVHVLPAENLIFIEGFNLKLIFFDQVRNEPVIDPVEQPTPPSALNSSVLLVRIVQNLVRNVNTIGLTSLTSCDLLQILGLYLKDGKKCFLRYLNFSELF